MNAFKFMALFIRRNPQLCRKLVQWILTTLLVLFLAVWLYFKLTRGFTGWDIVFAVAILLHPL